MYIDIIIIIIVSTNQMTSICLIGSRLDLKGDD